MPLIVDPQYVPGSDRYNGMPYRTAATVMYYSQQSHSARGATSATPCHTKRSAPFTGARSMTASRTLTLP